MTDPNEPTQDELDAEEIWTEDEMNEYTRDEALDDIFENSDHVWVNREDY